VSLLWTLLLALVQGLTEFFPVSSSAHLTILGAIAGIKEDDALVFFLVLHSGTLLATLVFFSRDLWALFLGLVRFDRASWRYAGLILLTTVPTGLIGLAAKPYVQKAETMPALAGGVLFFTAVYLWCTRYLPAGTKADRDINWADALLIGLAQGAAVCPGISRSGATISSGLARGIQREAAFRYSFLASLPAIGGAFLLEARHAFTAANPHVWDDALGAAVSFGAGLFALWFWRRTVIKHGPHLFAFWCLATGCLGIAVGLFLNK
jgi:undecaprenyl-diphosphatase